jgi:hypothetical protein
VHRVNEHAGLGVEQLDPLDQLDAVPLLQAEVDNQEIGASAPELLDGGRLIFGFSADLQIVLMFDQQPHPLSEHLMVIDEENLRPCLLRAVLIAFARLIASPGLLAAGSGSHRRSLLRGISPRRGTVPICKDILAGRYGGGIESKRSE